MATVTMIEENTADAEVREVYGDIKETRGINYIPNIWKTLAAHPPTLKRIWLGIKSVMAAGRLDPLTSARQTTAIIAFALIRQRHEN